MILAKRRRRLATRWERKRYARCALNLMTRKNSTGGIVGISKKWKRWYVRFPKFLYIKPRSAQLAEEAAMQYNEQMLALFGEDAVLCDVNAAMELDRRMK